MWGLQIMQLSGYKNDNWQNVNLQLERKFFNDRMSFRYNG